MPPRRNPVLILDNGAHTIKAGLSTDRQPKPRILYNAAIRSKGDRQMYIGHQFEKCKDYASLTHRLSFERGYLTDWDVQKAVWDELFGPSGFSLDFSNTSALITEPPFNFHSTQEKYDQLIFEEYEFASYVRCPAAFLTPYGSMFAGDAYPECSIIIDSGFSFTHVIPMMHDSILWNGVRRIDVGGKLLTNHLSTLVSFRQWNMLDQTHIVNDVKEKCCYVTSFFTNDLERCRCTPGEITLQYVLPDFSRNRQGYVWDPNKTGKALQDEDAMDSASPINGPPSDSDQVLYMQNERFSVPELIFTPSDIGLSQAGLAQTVADAISVLPENLQGLFWANIGLLGGNTRFPNFANRLLEELRQLAPVEYEAEVYSAEDPMTETYKAAHSFANSSAFASVLVSREEYLESGSNACRRKFRAFDWDPVKERPALPPRPGRRERERVGSQTVDGSEDEKSEEEGKRGGRRAPPKKRDKPAPTRGGRGGARNK